MVEASPTAGEMIADLTQRFAAAGISSPRLDARLLVAEVLGVEPSWLLTHSETPLTSQARERLLLLAARREKREPMSHVLGRRGFWTLTLKVTADTLDPRPDTETLVETVLARLPDPTREQTILDLGTGTGALVLALLSALPRARGVGGDISPAALAVAQENAVRCGLADRCRFLLTDWGRNLSESLDVIVSNPPYIAEDEMQDLEPEVAHFEPRLALVGGADGLDCYRVLIPEAARLLAPKGLVALEIGVGQGKAVRSMLAEAGLERLETVVDLAGHERCIVAFQKE